MTNLERQKALDKKKWIKSEKVKHDCSGLMPYCAYCDYLERFEKIKCNLEQVDREMNCICAKAYNRMARDK